MEGKEEYPPASPAAVAPSAGPSPLTELLSGWSAESAAIVASCLRDTLRRVNGVMNMSKLVFVAEQLATAVQGEDWPLQQVDVRTMKLPTQRQLLATNLGDFVLDGASAFRCPSSSLGARLRTSLRMLVELRPSDKPRAVVLVGGAGSGKTAVLNYVATMAWVTDWFSVIVDGDERMMTRSDATSSKDRRGRGLLLLDSDGEEEEAMVKSCSRLLSLLGSADNHCAVLTVRKRFSDDLLPFPPEQVTWVELPKLSERDAAAVASLILPSGDSSSNATLRRLVSTLGCMPAALKLAGMYLSANSEATVTSLLDRLSGVPADELPAGMASELEGSPEWKAAAPLCAMMWEDACRKAPLLRDASFVRLLRSCRRNLTVDALHGAYSGGPSREEVQAAIAALQGTGWVVSDNCMVTIATDVFRALPGRKATPAEMNSYAASRMQHIFAPLAAAQQRGMRVLPVLCRRLPHPFATAISSLRTLLVAAKYASLTMACCPSITQLYMLVDCLPAIIGNLDAGRPPLHGGVAFAFAVAGSGGDDDKDGDKDGDELTAEDELHLRQLHGMLLLQIRDACAPGLLEACLDAAMELFGQTSALVDFICTQADFYSRFPPPLAATLYETASNIVRDNAALGGQGCARWCLLRHALACCQRQAGDHAAAAREIASVALFLSQMDGHDALFPMVKASVLLEAAVGGQDAASCAAAVQEYAAFIIPAAARNDYPLALHGYTLVDLAPSFHAVGMNMMQTLVNALMDAGNEAPLLAEAMQILPDILSAAEGDPAALQGVRNLTMVALRSMRVTDDFMGEAMANLAFVAARFCDTPKSLAGTLRQLLSLAVPRGIVRAPRSMLRLLDSLCAHTVAHHYHSPGLLVMLDAADRFLTSKGVHVTSELRLPVLLSSLHIRTALPQSWVDGEQTLALVAELIDAEGLPHRLRTCEPFFEIAVALDSLGHERALELMQRLYGRVVRELGRYARQTHTVRMLVTSLYCKLQRFEQAGVIWQGALDQFRQAADAAQVDAAQGGEAAADAAGKAMRAASGMIMLFLYDALQLEKKDAGWQLVKRMAADVPPAITLLASCDAESDQACCYPALTTLLMLDCFNTNDSRFVDAVVAVLRRCTPPRPAVALQFKEELLPALEASIGGASGTASIAAALLARLPEFVQSDGEYLFTIASVILPSLSSGKETLEDLPALLESVHAPLRDALPSMGGASQLGAVRGLLRAASGLFLLGELELLDSLLATCWHVLSAQLVQVTNGLSIVVMSAVLPRLCAAALQRCAALDIMLSTICARAGRRADVHLLSLLCESAAAIMTSCGRQEEWAKLAAELPLPSGSSKLSTTVNQCMQLVQHARSVWRDKRQLIDWGADIRSGSEAATAADVWDIAAFCAASLPEGSLPASKMRAIKALPRRNAAFPWTSMVLEGATMFSRPALPLARRAPLLRELCLKLMAAARVEGGTTLWLHGRASVGKTQLARAAAQALWTTDAFDAIIELAALHPLPLLPQLSAVEGAASLLLVVDEGVPLAHVEQLRSRVSDTVVLMVSSSPPDVDSAVVAIEVPPLPAGSMLASPGTLVLVQETAAQELRDAWHALCAAEADMADVAPRLCALGSQLHSKELLVELIGERARALLASLDLLEVAFGKWQALPSLLVQQLAAGCSAEQLAAAAQQLADVRARLLADTVELSLVSLQAAQCQLAAQLPGLLAAALRGEAIACQLARHPLLVYSATPQHMRQLAGQLAASWPSEEEGGLPPAVRDRLAKLLQLLYDAQVGSDDALDDAMLQAAVAEGAQTAAQALASPVVTLPVVHCLQRELLASPARVARIGAQAAWLQACIIGHASEAQAAYAAAQLTAAAMQALGLGGGDDLLSAARAFVEREKDAGKEEEEAGKEDDVRSPWEAAREAVGELELPDAFPVDDVPAQDVQLLRASAALLTAALTGAEEAMLAVESMDELAGSPLLFHFTTTLLTELYLREGPPTCMRERLPRMLSLLQPQIDASAPAAITLFNALNVEERIMPDSLLVGPAMLQLPVLSSAVRSCGWQCEDEPQLSGERLLVVSCKLATAAFVAPSMPAAWESVVLHASVGRDRRRHLATLPEDSSCPGLAAALADALLCEGKQAEDALVAAGQALVGSSLQRTSYAVTLTAVSQLAERQLNVADAALLLVQRAIQLGINCLAAVMLLKKCRQLPRAAAAVMHPAAGFTIDNVAGCCALLDMLWEWAESISDMKLVEELIAVGAAALPCAVADVLAVNSLYLHFLAMVADAVFIKQRFPLPLSTQHVVASMVVQAGDAISSRPGMLLAVPEQFAAYLAGGAARAALHVEEMASELVASALGIMSSGVDKLLASTVALHVVEGAKAAGCEAELLALLKRKIAAASPMSAILLGKLKACLEMLYAEGFQAMVLAQIAVDDSDDEELSQLRTMATVTRAALLGGGQRTKEASIVMDCASALSALDGKSVGDLLKPLTIKKMMLGSCLIQVAMSRVVMLQPASVRLPLPLPGTLTHERGEFVFDVITGRVTAASR